MDTDMRADILLQTESWRKVRNHRSKWSLVHCVDSSWTEQGTENRTWVAKHSMRSGRIQEDIEVRKRFGRSLWKFQLSCHRDKALSARFRQTSQCVFCAGVTLSLWCVLPFSQLCHWQKWTECTVVERALWTHFKFDSILMIIRNICLRIWLCVL